MKKLIVALAMTSLMVMAIGISNVLAKPKPKEGNAGLPGCLATVDQQAQIILDQDSTILGLQDQINELQAELDAMENYSPVPKTGRTTSWLPGDDGDLQIGVPWPDPRFTDKLDGTVIDNLTSLIWTKSANLFGYTYSFSDALTFCSSCDEGGYTDWRLPNVRELQSLIDYGQVQYEKPILPAGHPFTGPFGPGDQWYYWSSTSQGVTSAFCISFENGFMWSLSAGNVWCVRGGSN